MKTADDSRNINYARVICNEAKPWILVQIIMNLRDICDLEVNKPEDYIAESSAANACPVVSCLLQTEKPHKHHGNQNNEKRNNQTDSESKKLKENSNLYHND
jgi:hypothetical protein